MIEYHEKPVLKDINLSLMSNERLAIIGKNDSGKTTLIKEIIIKDNSVRRSGDWHVSNSKDIGYLDQHYSDLDSTKSPSETMANPSWSVAETRKHLNC